MKVITSVEFIDGYLNALANFCHGCDYVPVYGANEVSLLEGNLRRSIDEHLKDEAKLFDFKPLSGSKKKFRSNYLTKWVEEKLLEGQIVKKRITTRSLFQQHLSDLIELIDDIVSSNAELYSFKLAGEDFGNETEALCFKGNGKCFYVYFGWWD